MNYAEKIKNFEATLLAKSARLEEIQEKVGGEGRTKDEAEREEFDTLKKEMESIRAELTDLEAMQKFAVQKAVPVQGATPAAAAASRAGQVVVKAAVDLPQGIRFARVVKAVCMAHRRNRDVEVVAREMYPDDALVQKGAVVAGSTTDGNWAAALTGDEGSVFADFVEFLRPQTILGKFGAGGIPSLRRVPFRTPLITQTLGGEGYWVGEGKPKPLTAFGTSRTTLEPLKVANITVLTDELVRSSSPSAEALVRDQLAAALRQRLDIDFINPDKAAVAGVSPASILNGITPIPSSGATADDVRADMAALLSAFISANNPPTSGVLIMPATFALTLSLMRNTLGQREFDAISMNGGTVEGLPVIVSENVGSDDYGAIVALINAQDVYLADDGGVQVDASREASLEMLDSALQQDALTGAGASLVSMFQTNSVAVRAERIINWARRRDTGVQFLSDVLWAV